MYLVVRFSLWHLEMSIMIIATRLERFYMNRICKAYTFFYNKEIRINEVSDCLMLRKWHVLNIYNSPLSSWKLCWGGLYEFSVGILSLRPQLSEWIKIWGWACVYLLKIIFSKIQSSHSVVSNPLWPHGLQHTRPPCASPLPEPTRTHVYWVGDDIQPSHPLLSPSSPAFNLSQHQGLF